MHHLDRRKNARGQAVVTLLAVILMTVAGAGLGLWIGHYQHLTTASTSLAASSSPYVLPHTSLGSSPLSETQPFSEVPATLDEVAVRVSELQAYVSRLNALGERLVHLAGLAPEEFDFLNPPPRGGAEDGPAADYTIREIASELGSLVDLVQDRHRKLDRIEGLIDDENRLARHIAPSAWPVPSGYISSGFGFRVHPIKKARLFHQGVDFASPRGTPILAYDEGVVTFSGKKGGYGRMVDIRHRDGLVTRYAHNQANLVKEGDQVKRGQKIATVGSSGTATGPHVHFEIIKDGKAIDPMRYLDRQPPRRMLAGTSSEQSG